MNIHGLQTDKYGVEWIRGQRSSSLKSQAKPGFFFFFFNIKPLLLAGYKILLTNSQTPRKLILIFTAGSCRVQNVSKYKRT